MKNVRSNLPILLISILAIIMALSFVNRKDTDEINYSDFRKLAFKETGSIVKASIDNNAHVVNLETKDGKKKVAKLPKDLTGNSQLADELDKAGIQITINDSKSGDILYILSNLLFPLLLILPLFFLMRGISAGGGQAFNFIKSKAKLLGEQKIKITFANVAGVEEAKQELREIVEFLKDGEKFRALGAKIPKGVLLVGPPGTGKTLLAKAVAGEAGVPFFSISGSDFVEMFVGVGASRVRDLFEQARKQAPCIVFVDEIDAVGRKRGSTMGGHDEREQTLNQLLVEMDGFDSSNSSVIVLAATNRSDVLDSALTRPGRFDRQVTVDYPDVRGREAILKVHSEGKILDENIDLKTLAKRTVGFTGADLANVMNEAALIAAGKSKKTIDMIELEEATDKVYLGAKRMIRVPFHELEAIAYHETGHALMNIINDKDPNVRKKTTFHKVTIVPRGKAGGVSWSVNSEDHVNWTRKSLYANIKVALAGMAIEEIVFADTSAGVGSDLKNATRIARMMITQFGMSDLGPMAFGEFGENFLGDTGFSKDFSEDSAREIDLRVKNLLQQIYKEVKQTLSEKREVIDAIVLELLDKETLEAEDLQRIISGVEEKTFNFQAARQKVEELKAKIEIRDADEVKKLSVAA